MADREVNTWLEKDLVCGPLTWRPLPALRYCQSLQPKRFHHSWSGSCTVRHHRDPTFGNARQQVGMFPSHYFHCSISTRAEDNRLEYIVESLKKNQTKKNIRENRSITWSRNKSILLVECVQADRCDRYVHVSFVDMNGERGKFFSPSNRSCACSVICNSADCYSCQWLLGCRFWRSLRPFSPLEERPVSCSSQMENRMHPLFYYAWLLTATKVASCKPPSVLLPNFYFFYHRFSGFGLRPFRFVLRR